MKKSFFLLLIQAVFCIDGVQAQISSLITTDPLAWSHKKGNLHIQATYGKTGVFANGFWQPVESHPQGFWVQSVARGIQTGGLIFPFGTPFKIRLKDDRPIYLKKYRGQGCSNKKLCSFVSKKRHPLSGWLIGIGYLNRQQSLRYVAPKSLDAPVSEYNFNIKSQGILLSNGYQIHIGPCAVGIQSIFSADQPHVKGPVDIFRDDLYSFTFPKRLRIQHQLMFQAGFAF